MAGSSALFARGVGRVGGPSDRPWAIEVKTGSLAVADLKGLAGFTRRFPRFRPLVLCDQAGLAAAEFLLTGLPG